MLFCTNHIYIYIYILRSREVCHPKINLYPSVLGFVTFCDVPCMMLKFIHIYIYLPTVHHRGRTQECSKALVVLLSFYWIKVSQLRFIFVFYIYIYICIYIYA